MDYWPIIHYLSLDRKGFTRVLDVMAGFGIAGAALAKALTLRGLKEHLTVSDVRMSDLQLAR
jgi:16S rRNA G1207 methylase RsmC